MYSCILVHGAFNTFSKIATAGCSCSRYSTAARKVSPEVPLSSISVELADESLDIYEMDGVCFKTYVRKNY